MVSGLLPCALVWLLAAPGAVLAGSATAMGVETHSGDCYVLIASPTGVEPPGMRYGVYRFRREIPGDDNTYYKVRLGEHDPVADYDTAPFLDPLGDAYGLTVDKFNRVYVMVNRGDSTYKSIDWSAAPRVEVTHTHNLHMTGTDEVGSYDGPHYDGPSAPHTYDFGRIFVIKRDGTEDFYKNVYPSDPDGTPYRFPAEEKTETIEVRVWPGKARTKTATDRIFVFEGSPDKTDVLLPPPVECWPPWPQSNSHGSGRGGCSLVKGYWPFPTSSTFSETSDHRVVIPYGEWWMTREDGWYPGHSAPHGWIIRKLTDLKYMVERMHLCKYLDFPDATALSMSAGPYVDGSAIYVAVGTELKWKQTNSCGDFCIDAAATGTEVSPPARGKIIFSTYGEELNEERCYGIKQVQDLASGSYVCTLQKYEHVSGTWDATDIPFSASNVILLDGAASDPVHNSNSLGIAAKDATEEWIYVSDADPNHFCVSSLFFRTGGTVWRLNPATGVVTCRERDEISHSEIVRTIGLGSGVTEIAADGLMFLYYLRSARDPAAPVPGAIGTSYTPSGADPFTIGVDDTNPIDVDDSPYFAEIVDPGPPANYRFVYFYQYVGKDVMKTSAYSSSPRKIGHAEKGRIRWSRKQIKCDSSGNPLPEGAGALWDGSTVKWASNTYYQVDTDIDMSVRSEIAAVNIAIPPLGEENTLDLMIEDSGGSIVAASREGTYHDTYHAGAARSLEYIEVEEDADPGYIIDIENPPRFAGINRSAFGRGNVNYSPMDQDGDGRIGAFAYAIIDPDILGAAEKPQYHLRFKWEINKITHADVATAVTTATVTDSGSTIQPWSGTLQYADPISSYTLAPDGFYYCKETATGLGDEYRIARLKVPTFEDPGRYEVKLIIRGGIWDIDFSDFNSPVTFDKDTFEVAYSIVINVRAKNPLGDSYVYDVKVVSPQGGALQGHGLVEEDQARPVFCTGLIKFFTGQFYSDSSNRMDKSTGVGTWDYYDPAPGSGWSDSRTPPHPDNDPATVTDPITGGSPSCYDQYYALTRRNDADGDWGTRARYVSPPGGGVGTPGEDDMLPASWDKSDQRLRDWYSIKYEWILGYYDPETGAYRERTYRKGTLAELVALELLARNGHPELYSRLLGDPSHRFVEYAANGRIYRFRVPLLDPAVKLDVANIYDETDLHSWCAEPVNALASLNGGDIAGIAPPVWYVPTYPSHLKLTCRVYYQKVGWGPVLDLNKVRNPGAYGITPPDPTAAAAAGGHTDPSWAPSPQELWLVDEDGEPLYYSARRIAPTAAEAGVHQVSAALPEASLYWSCLYESGRVVPDPMEDQDPFGGSDDNDYFDLMVLDRTPPRIAGTTTAGVVGSASATGTVALHGDAGKRIREDHVYVQVVDNDPYLHFTDWRTPAVGGEYPSLLGVMYECGPDGRLRDGDGGGIGYDTESGVAGYYGFNIARRAGEVLSGFTENSPLEDYPGDTAHSRPADASMMIDDGLIMECNGGSAPNIGDGVYAAVLDDPTHRCHPDFITSESHFSIDAGSFSGITAWNRSSEEDANYRASVYGKEGVHIPVPAFLPYGTDTLSLLALGTDESAAGFTVDGSEAHYTLPDGSAYTGSPSMDDRRPTTYATVAVRDTAPPNVSVDVLDSSEGASVHFVAFTRFGRDMSGPLDDYFVVKRSPDNRNIMSHFPAYSAVAGSPYMYPPDWSTLGVCPGGFPVSHVLDFSTMDFDPAASADPEPYVLRFNEDVQLVLTVRACDNVSEPSVLQISVHGDPACAHPFPEMNDVSGTVVKDLAVLNLSHYYPTEGEEDTVTVSVRDQAGNERRIRFRVKVYAHDIDFRIISDKERKQ